MQKQQKEKKLPERKCVGCGISKPKKELVRVVRSPEGEISLDPIGKAAGRGAYICKSLSCLEAAKKTKRLEKNLNSTIDGSVYERLEKELSKASGEVISDESDKK